MNPNNVARPIGAASRGIASKTPRRCLLALAVCLAVQASTVCAQEGAYPADPLQSRRDTGTRGLPERAGVVDLVHANADYSVNAAVGRIRVEVDQDSLPADGQTPAKLHIKLLGKDGQPLAGRALITIEASGGRLQLPGANGDELGSQRRDVDRIVPGLQVPVENGQAEVWLLAPYQPQDVAVKVIAGDQVAEGVIAFVPELRDMFAVGLIDGVISFDKKSPLEIDGVRENDGFEQQVRSWARDSGDGKRNAALRTAFFLKGKIKGETLLTLAYDSDKPERSAMFRDLDPQRWYPVYGDASIVGFEARSTSRLYLRLDNGRNYLLWGDIATGAGFSQQYGQGAVAGQTIRDLGQYNRAMTGVRGHHETERSTFDVFAAYDDQRRVIEEFPGRGISGPYTISNSATALQGTERIELVVRDRNAPSLVVSTTQLQRFSDYNFEPFSGRILFNRAIPSLDENLNPVSVRISYEIEQGGDKYWVYGANGQYKFNQNFEIGGSYVKDKNPLAPYELGSVNATAHITDHTWISAEWARSKSAANSLPLSGGYSYLPDPLDTSEVSGNAWRAEFHHDGAHADVGAYAGQSDAEFNNAAASFLGGRREFGITGRFDVTDQMQLYARGNHTEERASGAERDQAEAGVLFSPSERLTLDFGLHWIDERAGSYAGNGYSTVGSITAPYGVGVVSPGFGGGFYGSPLNAVNPATGSTLYNTGSGWSNGYGSWVGNGLYGLSMNYTALRLGATWRPASNLTLSAEVEQDVSESEHRRASVGASYQIHEGTRVYGRYEWNTGLSAVSAGDLTDANGNPIATPYDSDALVFGVENEYLRGHSMFNEYRMYDAISGRQAQSAAGLRDLWQLSETLALQTAVERLEVHDGSGQTASAISAGLEWRPSDLWTVSGRVEWRKTDAAHVDHDDGEGDSALTDSPTVAPWLTGGYTTWLSTLAVARKIDADWSLLARNYYLRNSYDDGRKDSWEDRLQLGAAYRDTDRNRLNVLALYEYWRREDYSFDGLGDSSYDPYGTGGGDSWLNEAAAGYTGYTKHLFSINADYHPSRPWWLTGRIAAKWQTDRFDGKSDDYRAYLIAGRATYDLSERWDVSVLASRLFSPTGSAEQYAYGLEVGYLLTSNLWLSSGYNWRGFDDDDLTGGQYTNQGAFIRLRFKFDSNLFRGKDATVNPALPR